MTDDSTTGATLAATAAERAEAQPFYLDVLTRLAEAYPDLDGVRWTVDAGGQHNEHNRIRCHVRGEFIAADSGDPEAPETSQTLRFRLDNGALRDFLPGT